MESAIAVFIKFYKDDVDYAFWQNFWGQSTGFDFVNFTIGDILMNRTADEGGVALEFPPQAITCNFLEAAIAEEYLAQVQVYEMPITEDYLPSNMTLIAQFVGEVISMATDLTAIEVELGAAIDAISGDIPGRKITTSLVGRLPSL